MSFADKVEIVLLSGLFFAILTTVLLLAYVGLDLISLAGRFSVITRYLGALIPTVILSGLALILVDNFTYTVFKFGISTVRGIWRGVYGLLFVILLIYIYTRILRFIGIMRREIPGKQPYQRLFNLAIGLSIVSIGLALIRLDYGKLISPKATAEIQHVTKHPNILLIGGDGLNADNLSLYGYERDTTPRIQELAKSSLVAENAFTNAGNSAGSIISIFTSKLPTQTRVLYPPDILTGVNAFQHLPGMLKLNGYTTVELGYPYYIDAYNLNVQNGFDMVNNRSRGNGQFDAIAQRTGYGMVAYFLDSLFERISDRVFHIFYLREMQNPYDLVIQPIDKINDEEKIDRLLDLIDRSEEPLFIHLHLIGTHGDKFYPPVNVYSKGEEQDQPWMVDFYDDSIIAFDQYVGKIIDGLKANGQYDNTVLIIYSDHAMRDRVNLRVPLIMHFPGDEYTGKITYSVQNMDIAPTILDYLGLPEPGWMDGASVLKGDVDSHRLIFSTVTAKTKPNEKGVSMLDPERVKPPFYQFSYVNIVDCQKWYQLNLATFAWSDGEVPGYTTPCRDDSLKSLDEIKQAMVHRLEADGFDLSTLP
jgi:arylsulfatase A-like enzyme